MLTWLPIGCSHFCDANQKLAFLLTQLLTMTTTHTFPSLLGLLVDRVPHRAQLHLAVLGHLVANRGGLVRTKVVVVVAYAA